MPAGQKKQMPPGALPAYGLPLIMVALVTSSGLLSTKLKNKFKNLKKTMTKNQSFTSTDVMLWLHY